jgi:predicted RNase H-like HicB family nuclease/uncharacterized protein (DUF1778 family)
MDYIAFLYKDSNSDFGVVFPDFPGCVTAGETLQEAKAMASEALQFHIEGMLEDGEEIPNPSTLDQLSQHEDIEGSVAFLVPAILPGKQVRFNVSARENQLAVIDQAAAEAGLTRSAYMVLSSIDKAHGLSDRRQSLFERITANSERINRIPRNAETGEFVPTRPTKGSGKKLLPKKRA